MKKRIYISPSSDIHDTHVVLTILAGSVYNSSTKEVEEVENVELGANKTGLWEEPAE